MRTERATGSTALDPAAASLAERFAGGSGVHALVAGAIGTIAVIAGGWRRLSAPLLLGTAVLVAAGIAMGRAEVGPIETGRRVLDVVRDRFA